MTIFTQRLHAISLIAVFCIYSPLIYADDNAQPSSVYPAAFGLKTDVRYLNEATSVSEVIYKNPNFELDLSGYWQTDFAGVSATPSANLDNFANWRAGVLSTYLTFYTEWQLILTYDFSYSQIQNNTINYNPSPSYTFSLGQFSPIFGLANTDSTTAITFMELPLPVYAFSPLYELGGYAVWWGNDWSLALSLFTDGIQTEYQGRDPIGSTISVTYSPVHTDRHALHYSISEWIQQTDSTKTVEFETPPEIVFPSLETSLVSTPVIPNSSYYAITDLAFGWVYNSFNTQTEYLQTIVKRSGMNDLMFEGGYIDASYFLTGESKLYSFQDLAYAGITAIQHSYGAWEVAGRLSYINLDDQEIQGGQELDASAALNWYPIRFLEWQLNYVHAKTFPGQTGSNESANLIAMRMLLLF